MYFKMQPYIRWQKGNYKLLRLTTTMKIEGINNLRSQINKVKTANDTDIHIHTQHLHHHHTTPKVTRINSHWSLISLNTNGSNSSMKRQSLTNRMRKQDLSYYCIQEIYLCIMNIKLDQGKVIKIFQEKDLRSKLVQPL